MAITRVGLFDTLYARDGVAPIAVPTASPFHIGTTALGASVNPLLVEKDTAAAGSTPTVRLHGHSCSYEILNAGSTQNWYWGVADSDSNKLYIGRGYGPNQGITPAIRITTADVVELPIGQLKFPATQNPSSDVNTLDDYEEGEWTPTDASGAGLSLTNSGSTYTKIGRLVFITGYVIYPTTSDTLAAKIGSLPFTCKASRFSALAIGYDNNNGGADKLLVRENSTTIEVYGVTGGARTNANLSTTNLVFAGAYVI